MTYPKTGFAPGRPRIGEIRVVTPANVSYNKWRDANLELARANERERAAKWRAANPERAMQQAQAAVQRRKIREAAPDFHMVVGIAAGVANVLNDVKVRR